MQSPTGFFGALFDFSFSEFVTTKIIRLVYIIAIAVAVFVGLIWIIGGFARSFAIGLLFLIFAPVLVLLYIIVARIYLEVIIVIFRIGEDVRALVRQGEETPPADAPPTSPPSAGPGPGPAPRGPDDVR